MCREVGERSVLNQLRERRERNVGTNCVLNNNVLNAEGDLEDKNELACTLAPSRTYVVRSTSSVQSSHCLITSIDSPRALLQPRT